MNRLKSHDVTIESNKFLYNDSHGTCDGKQKVNEIESWKSCVHYHLVMYTQQFILLLVLLWKCFGFFCVILFGIFCLHSFDGPFLLNFFFTEFDISLLLCHVCTKIDEKSQTWPSKFRILWHAVFDDFFKRRASNKI